MNPNRDFFWRPALLVFIGNANMMVAQLVAGRLMARNIGVSLYSWTGIIGVMLAGISLGNFLGGWLADRFASRRALSLALMLAGLGSISIVLIAAFADNWLAVPRWAGVPLALRMLALIGAVFFLPSLLMGLISPFVIKLAMRDLASAGATVGRIQAASSLGGIAGTFLAGFLLIAQLGTWLLLVEVGLLYIALGALTARPARPAVSRAAAAALLLAGAALPWTPARDRIAERCMYETNYFCIRVRDRDFAGRTYRTLTLDRLVHSYTNLEDPFDLRYQYEKAAAETADAIAERDGQVRAFFIGGGGYTLPRYVDLRHPGSLIDVAEIDPMVTEVAHLYFGLPRDTPIRAHAADARLYLAALPADAPRYNYVLGDAFNDFSVPYHLTTHEFNQLVRGHMTDNGIYMLNLIDGGALPFVSAYVRTLKQTFPHVAVLSNTPDLRAQVRNTFVVLASPAPLDLAALGRHDGGDGARNIAAWLVPSADIDAVLALGPQVVLSDDFAPTDRLLAPMFEASDALQ